MRMEISDCPDLMVDRTGYRPIVRCGTDGTPLHVEGCMPAEPGMFFRCYGDHASCTYRTTQDVTLIHHTSPAREPELVTV